MKEELTQITRLWVASKILSRAVVIVAAVSLGSCAVMGGGSFSVQWETGQNGK